MSVLDRLAALDRRVLPELGDPALLYDAPAPWWLRRGWLLAMLGPLSILLQFVAPVLVVLACSVSVMASYGAFAVTWRRRHRLNPRG